MTRYLDGNRLLKYEDIKTAKEKTIHITAENLNLHSGSKNHDKQKKVKRQYKENTFEKCTID